MNFGEKVVAHRKIILIVSLLLMIPAALGFIKTRVNYDMLTYLPKSIDTVKGQETLMEEFSVGGFSIITVEDMKTREVSDLVKDIEQVKDVDKVLNVQQLVDPSIPIEVYPKAIANSFSNKDVSMLVVFYDTSTSAEETLNAVSEIRKLGGEHAYVSGMSALVLDLKNICETEEPKYVLAAVILSLLAMMFLLDSFFAPFLFMASIGMAILYNLGSNIFFGEISYITKAIAAVLQLGVTMDYSIFLWHSYMEKMDAGMEEKEGMAQAVNDTLTAVTGSSVTTIAGFLALCAMSYMMGMDLGIVMAKGVAFGVIASVTILPVLLLFFTKTLRRTRHKSLIPDLTKLSEKLTSRYAIYVVIFALLVFPALRGYNNINVTYDFTDMMAGSASNLDEDQTQFLTAAHKMQDSFGIATSYIIVADANLSARDGHAMSDHIKDVLGVKNVLGMDAFLGTSMPKEMLPSGLESSLRSDTHQMILINSEYKISTDECNDQIDKVKAIVKEYDPTATVIGEGPATKDLITITDKDFNVVTWISIGLVFLIILFVLKSALLPVLLVALIEFAIYANLGICGYTGIQLPFIVPICISTIQLGSTVDYAILFSTRYKAERIAGQSRRDAVDIAATTSIPSIIVSALGFFTATIGVSIYSNISIISTFCTLMARGAIISMLTVIFLLPSLLMLFDRPICATTLGMRDIYKKEKAEGKALA